MNATTLLVRHGHKFGTLTAVSFFSLLLLLLGSGCAYNKNLQPAAATPETGEGGFELADTDHDGKLTRAQASDFIAGQIFTARDTNHDGRLTKAEWTAPDPSGSAEFKKRDANHDGIVTREEFLAYGRVRGATHAAFTRADRNHDGYLDKVEVQTFYASREGPPR